MTARAIRRAAQPLVALALVLALGAAAPTKADPAANHPAIIDVMSAYEAYAQQAIAAHGDAERVALFKRIVIDRYPELADAGVFPGDSATALIPYLDQLATLEAEMHYTALRLRSELPEYRAAFRRALPDFKLAFPTCMVPSFNYDGATGALTDGTPALLLGVPVLAKSGDAVPHSVLFFHEYFHLYHDQLNHDVFAERRPLGRELWVEGLATYASSVIAGERDPSRLFYDRDLARRYPGVAAQVARTILERYDSTSKDDRAAYFHSRRSPSQDLPSRSGYAVGYLVAQRLGATRSLRTLAMLRAPELDVLVRNALAALARGG